MGSDRQEALSAAAEYLGTSPGINVPWSTLSERLLNAEASTTSLGSPFQRPAAAVVKVSLSYSPA